MKLYYYTNAEKQIVNLFNYEQMTKFLEAYPNLTDKMVEVDKEGEELEYLLKYSTFLKVVDDTFVLNTNLYESYSNNANKFVRITELKDFLASSDFKVIKCYEASMLNDPLPYDLTKLVAERKAWRDELNELTKNS